MAKDNPTQNHRPVTVTVAEINTLCERLTARATSILLRDQPEQARDMVLGVKVIRALMRHINSSDVLVVENGVA